MIQTAYSRVKNRRPCTFISGKVCLLASIKVKRQTLQERNVQSRLFRTLEYKGILRTVENAFAQISYCYSSNKIRKTQNEHLIIVCQNLIGL